MPSACSSGRARGEQRSAGAKLRAYIALGSSFADAVARMPQRDAQGRSTQAVRSGTRRSPGPRAAPGPRSRRFADDEAEHDGGAESEEEGEETAEDRAFLDDDGDDGYFGPMRAVVR